MLLLGKRRDRAKSRARKRKIRKAISCRSGISFQNKIIILPSLFLWEIVVVTHDESLEKMLILCERMERKEERERRPKNDSVLVLAAFSLERMHS